MTDKEMRKLSRADLLELLIEQSQEVQQLRTWLKQAEEQLASRHLDICDAGSIAEAALRVNGVFEAAEAAAQQYLENIRLLSQRQEEICLQMERDCREKIRQQLAETQAQCDEMIANAKLEAQRCLDESK